MTPTLRPLALAAAVFAGAFAASSPAVAAESYDNCTGFIDSIPATITTQGVWCLRKNVSMSLATGAAITIATNNVTIDCNDFKVGGLAAGTSSQALGIYANARLNATIRRCGVRGFFRGIWFDGEAGGGHLIESNRLDGNLFVGIQTAGDGNRIVDNRVLDTGGTTVFATAYGIYGTGDMVGNAVDEVFSDGANGSTYGLFALEDGAEVRDNRVRALLATGTGKPIGLTAAGTGQVVAGNRLSVSYANTGTGINGTGSATFCKENVVHGFGSAYVSCETSSANLPVLP